MQVVTLGYRTGQFSHPLPEWDSPQTLVLVFAARPLESDDNLWRQLKTHFPQSIIAGCSTSGEILGDRVTDGSASIAVVKMAHTHLKLAAPLPSKGIHGQQDSDWHNNFWHQISKPFWYFPMVFWSMDLSWFRG